jgi:Tfp pilus assembly protein FimT
MTLHALIRTLVIVAVLAIILGPAIMSGAAWLKRNRIVSGK